MIVLIMPEYAYTGTPEGERGYDLINEVLYKLTFSEIGNDQYEARDFAIGGYIRLLEINKGK